MPIADIKNTAETKMDQSIVAFKNNLTKVPPCSIQSRWTITAP